MSNEEQDPVPTVAALGLKDDAPRGVVKAIVTAAQAAGPTNPVAIENALTAFNLATLLKPGTTVASFAANIAYLARSGPWARIVEASK